MPRFSAYFGIKKSQYQLDFVDISNEYDTAVYVDPYAIEIASDLWAVRASEYIRVFSRKYSNLCALINTIEPSL